MVPLHHSTVSEHGDSATTASIQGVSYTDGKFATNSCFFVGVFVPSTNSHKKKKKINA